jgi:hypothetical protein
MSKVFALLVYDIVTNNTVGGHFNLGDITFLFRSTVQGHIQSIGVDIVKKGVFPVGKLSRVTLDTLPDDVTGNVYVFIGALYKYIVVCE